MAFYQPVYYATSTAISNNSGWSHQQLQQIWQAQQAYQNSYHTMQNNIPAYRPQKLTKLIRNFLLSGQRPMPGEIERAI